jgi:hypothetical protein
MVPRLVVSLGTLVLLSAHAVDAQQAPTRRVAVATHMIARGASLSAGDFEFRDISSARGGRRDLNRRTPWALIVQTRRSQHGLVFAAEVEPPTAVSANSKWLWNGAIRTFGSPCAESPHATRLSVAE